MQARWPVANGGINDEFIQLFFRLQRVKPGFNLFGSTGDQRRFTAGNARRSAAGRRAKATACASLPTVTRWPFSSSTPHTRPAAPARRRWPDRQQPPRTATIASRGLSSRQRLNTARRSALSPLRWAAKTKFQSRRAASSALSGWRRAKTVCPARRIGVARRPLPGLSQRQPVIQLRQLIGKGPFLLLMQALLQGAGGERQAAAPCRPRIDAARREGGQQVKVFRDLIGAIVLERRRRTQDGSAGCGPAAGDNQLRRGARQLIGIVVFSDPEAVVARLRRVAPALMYAPACAAVSRRQADFYPEY